MERDRVSETRRYAAMLEEMRQTRPCRLVQAQESALRGPCRCGEVCMAGTAYAPPVSAAEEAEERSVRREFAAALQRGEERIAVVVGHRGGEAVVTLVVPDDDEWCVCPACARAAGARVVARERCRIAVAAGDRPEIVQ